jgi:hypothetical protein
LAVRPSTRPLPEARAPFGPVDANHRILFRPRVFSTPRRLAPRRGCGFVAPRCRLWGFARFPVPVPPAQWRWGRTSRFPRSEYPAKSSPRQQPCRITAVRCLLAVTVRPPGPSRPATEAAGIRGGTFPAGRGRWRTRVGRSLRGRFPWSVVASPTEVGGVSTGEAGASCPPIDLPPAAEAVGGRRLPKRASGGGKPTPCAGGASTLRSERDGLPGPAEAGPRARRRLGACRSRSVASVRVCASCRSRERGTRVGRCSEAAEAVGTSGPVWAACRSMQLGDRPLPERAERAAVQHPRPRLAPSHRGGPGAGGPCPGSVGCSDPPKRTPTSTRRARDREARWAGAEAPASVSSRAPEFSATFRRTRFQVLAVSCPPGERPTSRPCSADESVATSPPFPAMGRSCLPWAFSPSRSSRIRCCPPETMRRSARVRWRLPRAEARGPSWEGSRRRSPDGG